MATGAVGTGDGAGGIVGAPSVCGAGSAAAGAGAGSAAAAGSAALPNPKRLDIEFNKLLDPLIISTLRQ